MEFHRQEDWNGVLFPSPGDLPNPGIEPAYPALAGGFFITEPPGIMELCHIISDLCQIYVIFLNFVIEF